MFPLRRLTPLAALLALAAAPAGAPAAGAGDCARLPPPRGTVIPVSPGQADELPAIVRDAPPGATILLANGTYRIRGGDYGRRLLFRRAGVTLRSASGDPEGVVLDGAYEAGALVHVFADDVTIAEVTLTRAQDHLVHAYPDENGPHVRGLSLYRLRLVDSGEQFVKVNPSAGRGYWVDHGVVACSRFTMTAAGRQNIERAFGCYTGGIDAHAARGWRIRDNVFEGIYCDDGEVAEHAVHFWVGSRDTLVENNVVLNCSRAIGFGLGGSTGARVYIDDPYPEAPNTDHYGGVIRNNAVLADVPQYDTGIELARARGARVVHNTVAETDRATRSFSSIDYRFPETSVEIRNNLVRRITARDGGEAAASHNVESFPLGWLVDPVGGDFHLRPDASGAIDRGVAASDAGLDIDGVPHSHGPPDIGADEVTPPGVQPLRGRMRLRARGVRRRGRVLRVVGRVTPYVAGERVQVRFRRRGRTVRRMRARLREGRPGSGQGYFAVRYRLRHTGRLTITARHRASARLAAFSARPLRVRVRP